MKLKRTLPPGRTYEQVWNHYLVEKEIAYKLMRSDRNMRKQIYLTMYDQLFSQVPDHPRLNRRENEQYFVRSNISKFSLLKRYLSDSVVFVEFGPGDCKFAFEVSKKVKFVYGIDISDQRSNKADNPKNFKLIVYDGYSLNELDKGTIDIVFSDQLIEHFHPEDTTLHFNLVYHLLKDGGKYIFKTPHAFSGPHDVSKYFSDKAEGFHLKEWTYFEMEKLLREIGYSKLNAFMRAKGVVIKMPFNYFKLVEKNLNSLPNRYKRNIARYLIRSIHILATK